MPRHREIKAVSEPLPVTRKAQLKDTLRWRFFDYVVCSIYVFIFLLPLLIWLIFAYYTFLADSDPSFWLLLLTYGVAIPLIVVFGLGIGGAINFFKKMYYGEGATVSKDFFEGVRKNAKASALVFLILGILYLVMQLLGGLIDSSSMKGWVAGIWIGVMYVVFIILFAILIFSLSQYVFYNARITQFLTNSVRFLIGDFFRLIGVTLVMVLPFMLFSLIPNFYVQMVVVVVCGLFYFGFATGMFMLYSMYIFDRTINKKNYPEIYKKGLAKEVEQ